MSLNKYITIVILLLCILLLSNGLYASDTENTDNPQQTPDETEEYIEQTTVNDYADLQNMFTKVNTSPNKYHEINITEGTYRFSQNLEGTFQSDIEKDITINGNNAILDGRTRRSFMVISANFKVTINNLTIRNMIDDTAPAIKNSGTLILNNVTIENNTANSLDSIGGGAIFTDGSMNLTNCIFKNNGGNIQASTILIHDQDADIHEINIKNCEFSDNAANSMATIYILGKTNTNIINCTFINETSINSTILNNKSNLTLDNCTFYDEKTQNIIINKDKCIINNSNFYNNNIENIILNEQKLSLINSEISDNQVNTAITNKKELTINNSFINNNTIHESLVLNNPSGNDSYYLNMINSTVSNNTANKTSGIENKYENMHIYINDSTFINNTSLLNEGILSDNSGNMYVTNTKFHNNTAEDLFKGSTENYKIVQDNEYLGNFLKIYLNTQASAFNNQLNIVGTLKTDDIYNTTVNTGQITLKENNRDIYDEIINTDMFNIDLTSTDYNLNSLTLYYDGMRDFRNSNTDIEVLLLKEEYEVTISNVTDTFVYGDYITFDLNIKNSGNITVSNVKLNDILPNGLVYVDSSDEFDSENNEYTLNLLNINENKTVKFYLIPDKYEDLNLEFNIYDNKKDETYSLSEEVKFLKPEISVNRLTAHPGELVNISAVIGNYNKDTISDVKFIFHYNEVKNFTYTFSNNVLTVENYKLTESLTKKDYYVEIDCDDINLLESFANTSKISVIKYETHSLVDYTISNNLLNLSVNVFDENNNLVKAGSVNIKVNGKSIKTLKINNGVALLENYKLTGNYLNEYNISLTYTGNNMYNTHSNNISATENKNSVDFILDYVIVNKTITLTIRINTSNSILPESGYVAVKINDKTILPKMTVQGEYFLIYDLTNIPTIHNITVAYYGNENYNEGIKSIAV